MHEQPVMDLCRELSGNLIRYKKGSIGSIAEEYEKIPEKGKKEKAEFVNDIDYDGKPVHVLRYREERRRNNSSRWLSSINYQRECEKMAETGRKRWKMRMKDLTAEELAGKHYPYMQAG